jgi:amidohydrolase
MELKSKVKELASLYFKSIVGIRNHLHENPELSYCEFKTSDYVKLKLSEMNIPFTDGYVKTGIVGKIEGKNPGKKIIALRADMDALPILEENSVSYKSKNEGVMHACGHDVHTASLLGTAKILNELRDAFEGTVLLVFQPAEEKLPGGAKLMLEAGALSNPKPELIIGQHVLPGMEAGKVGYRAGMYMASADEIYLTIKGKGGHGALPHQLVDTVLVTSHIIVALQQIVSRNAYAATPSVLSFGKVNAPGATNIIPKEVKVEGTFRTMDEKWRKDAHAKITKIATSVAEAMGATCDVNIMVGYPCLINNEQITQDAISFSNEVLGEENVVALDLRMTAEDFAYYSQEIPSTFYRLGVMDQEGTINSPLHSSTFNIEERALETGMINMAYLAMRFLLNN